MLPVFEAFVLRLVSSAASWLGMPFFRKKRDEYKARAAMESGGRARPLGWEEEVAAAITRLLATGLSPNLEKPVVRQWLGHPQTQTALAISLFNELSGYSRTEGPEIGEALDRYQEYTGEAPNFATGALSSILDGLSVVLFNSTNDDIRRLLAAATHLPKAIARELGRPIEPDVLKKRARAAAQDLLVNAQTWWRYPKTLIALQFSRINDNESSKALSSIEDLVEQVVAGSNVFLCGEAGSGKTTALIEIAQDVLARESAPVPVFIDAATWAVSGESLLGYIASLQPFLNQGLSAQELARLNENHDLLVLLNGWNEISIARQSEARIRLHQYIAGSTRTRLLVTSRSTHESFGISHAAGWQARNLNWERQREFIQTQLPSDKAKALIERLIGDQALRHASRNPLVLTGIVELQREAVNIPSNAFDIFDAVIGNLENSEVHKDTLRDTPISGMHRRYLEAIALAMNEHSTTILEESQARQVILNAAMELSRDKQIGPIPQPLDLLRVLSDHHLLQWENRGQAVRFAHQRFQEFFGARALLALFSLGGQNQKNHEYLVSQVINQPFWEDALLLLAEKVRDDATLGAIRNLLLKITLPVDLAFASRLAGAMHMGPQDGADWHALEEMLRRLRANGAHEPQQYAIACMIATRSAQFADVLWPLLEQVGSHDTGHRNMDELARGIELRQLGADAEDRIAAWHEQRRAEFVYDISSNPSNYRYIETLANHDPSPVIRESAIKALFFWFGADAAISAWRNAPPEVKSSAELLGIVVDQWRPDNVTLTSELIQIAEASRDSNVQSLVGRHLREHAGKFGVEAAKAALQNERTYQHLDEYVNLLEHEDPGWLTTFIREEIWRRYSVPDWIVKKLGSWPVDAQASFVDEALERLTASEHTRLDSSVVMVGVTDTQVRRLLAEGAQLGQIWPTRRPTHTESRRLRAIEVLLVGAPGVRLIAGILAEAPASSYAELTWLVEVLDRRTNRSYRQRSENDDWLPDVRELDALIEFALEKVEQRTPPQSDLEAYLSAVLARVDSIRYLQFILEATRRQMRAWQSFRVAADNWAKESKRSERPSNPSLGRLVSEALRQCGFAAIPGLLELIDEPEADNVVLEPLQWIVVDPWVKLSKRTNPVGGLDFQQAAIRRKDGNALRQPDASLQPDTDKVAAAVSKLLERAIYVPRARQANEPQRPTGASVKLFRYASVLARIPSPSVREAVLPLLAHSDISPYSLAEIAEVLISRGLLLPEESCLKPIQAAIAALLGQAWLDQHAHYLLGRLVRLLLFIDPVEHATQFAKDAFAACESKVGFWQIRDILSEVQIPSAVPLLLEHVLNNGLGKDYRDKALWSLAAFPAMEAGDALFQLLVDGRLRNVLEGHGLRFGIGEAVANRLCALVTESEYHASTLFTAIESGAMDGREALLCQFLAHLHDSRAAILMCRYLDAEQYPHCEDAVIDYFESQFQQSLQPTPGSGWYETFPQSANELRRQLFQLATSDPRRKERASRVLVAVEIGRQSLGRPNDEPRHPDLSGERAWPTSLFA